jgi:hypothetical protein
MDAEPVTQLVLEIHSSVPICGSVRNLAGVRWRFAGWLGLAAALGRALRSPPDAGMWVEGGDDGVGAVNGDGGGRHA